jgi:hypothetical protein
MITPADCRKIDPSLADMTDKELGEVLHTLYGLGEIALDSFCDSKYRRGVYGRDNEDMRK